MKIDETDRLLLALLRENARASTSELGRRVGLSRTTVQGRLERLERNGVIAGYTVKLGDEQERGQIRAHILITALPKFSAKVEVELKRVIEVRKLYSVSGAHDLIALVEAPSIEAMDRAIDRIGALDGVERTVSSIILSTRIDR
jgi:DNA-binding Lrp family transcriptional regulator